MNCKPGDLAIIVRCGAPGFEWSVGRLVRCIRFKGWHQGSVKRAHDAWEIEPFKGPDGGTYGYVRDADIRPIRDPGDDARDTRDILVPQNLKETA